MKNIFLKLGLICSIVTLLYSCSDDDLTGTSTLTPSNPSLSISLGFANSETLIEEDKDYPFTVSLSEAQIVDVIIAVNQVSGTATIDEDFSIQPVTIKAGTTSASGVISIIADELAEPLETATIRIGAGNESNVQVLNTETVTFNLVNLTEDDLNIGMTWSIDAVGLDGAALDALANADLRLLATDAPYTTILNGSNETDAFENFILTSGDADREYYIVADFDSVTNFGDLGSFDINLDLTFDQLGVINGETYNFPAALKSSVACSDAHFILAKITKEGNSYLIEKIGVDSEPVAGSWSGTDVTDSIAGAYASQVTTVSKCTSGIISGLNNVWMQTTWEEIIQTEGEVEYTIDSATGEVTIEEQFIFTTLYNGTLYDYTITANGTYDDSGSVPTMTINYTLDQDGFSPSQYMFDNGFMSTNEFIATLTLD